MNRGNSEYQEVIHAEYGALRVSECSPLSLARASHPSGIIEQFLLVGQSSPWVPAAWWLVMSVCSWLAGCGPEKLVKYGPER